MENFIKNINSKRNSLVNEVNWNILVTSGKEIKRDSISSVNESRKAFNYKVKYSLNYMGNLPQRLNIIHKR